MCECSSQTENCSICSVDLYDSIDKAHCSCLNEQSPNSIQTILNPNRSILRSNHSSQPKECISDCDGELLSKITFKGTVKMEKIFIKAKQPISTVRIFLNDLSIDFGSLSRVRSAQDWVSLENAAVNGVLELETQTWKFLNVSSCSIWIKSEGIENLALQHLGFSGEYLYSRNAPIVSSYEVAPQPNKTKEGDLLKGAFFQ